ncbi:MAG TPA: glycoside hydrolase family 2 TIM barrel-domain containing protein [Planctomycetota bacterium]|nr:glycoside hydrolase family 2 TIM barrel-domain containing protein [Planctomycetota bacterium]
MTFARAIAALIFLSNCIVAAADDAPLPAGVKAVWSLDKAWRETTPARERISLNGLWRWQPARNAKGVATPENPVGADTPLPDGTWGFFKVPGSWPGVGDYMQKDSQTVFAHAAWKSEKLSTFNAAWYQREISVPETWTGRRVTLQAEYLNSGAIVYIDGNKAGTLAFPGGELDLSAHVKPGARHILSMLVIAAPLSDVTLLFSDTNTRPQDAKRAKAKVARRGLCGDVFLNSEPAAARITHSRVSTSVRKSEIALDLKLAGLAADGAYTVTATVRDGATIAHTFTTQVKTADLKDGGLAAVSKWKAEKLWDIHTPQNQYTLELALSDANGARVDSTFPLRFGYREFWIDGRDFYLNGTRIFLTCIPLDNASVGSASCTYAAARETFERMKGFGINFVYTHNFGCEPGSHLSFTDILRAADDMGMLVSLTQPHFGQYDWKAADADASNGYARHAEFYVNVAGCHPSVVFYSMSHNATGYNEDMDPDLIDGKYERRQPWAQAGANRALRAEAIVKRLDPDRIVYHHSSGNLGSMHNMNFYPNFAPVQELSDWFEHWSKEGVKPLFTCEYGAPFSWDWTMYRGWYWNEKKEWVREFGSARAAWEFCIAEWNAQFCGDRAFQISDVERANLRWEAQQMRAGKPWFRWDYPAEVGSRRFSERYPILEKYFTENFRAYRTLGVSAISPWEHHYYWKTRDGFSRKRKELAVDWENLQRPGYSPDYIDDVFDTFPTAHERGDWVTTEASEALIRNCRPLLAYIGGPEAHVTSREHTYFAGEKCEKQLVIINNSRETVSCECELSSTLPQAVKRARKITIKTGEQARLKEVFEIPANTAPGEYTLNASVQFNSGETQMDSFSLHVLPRLEKPAPAKKPALFDPAGKTAQLLQELGIDFQRIEASGDLAGFDTLIVGQTALTLNGPAPDISRVREGLKVILFEQTSEVLEKRFGFRVAEYGLRTVFPRVQNHPLLKGIRAEHLSDWRGDATLVPPRLKVEMSDKRFNGAPTVKWCGIDVPRLWRCGCRGNVASVLIEKPARGNFLPIVDGGFSLQYSPLLEYREGKGMVLFCQLDVTARSESEPAAMTIARNIIDYASNWKPALERKAVYAGDAEGMAHLKNSGIEAAAFTDAPLGAEQVLIAGPGCAAALAGKATEISGWLKHGGRVVAVGLDDAEANAFLPARIAVKKAEHIAAWFPLFGPESAFAGVSPADIHNRDPRVAPLLSGGATLIGNGILGKTQDENVVFCQLPPWQFKYTVPQNTKRTFRRFSFTLSRILGNLGVHAQTPLLERFGKGIGNAADEKRWLNGFYLDQPEEWDDPYRFFRW